MAEAYDTRGARRRALAAERDADFFPLDDLPNDVLVSVFEAAEDPTWVRHTVPLVCRAWNELYCSQNASPLHETLEVNFYEEVRGAEAVAAAAARARGARHRDPAAGARRPPVVHASRVIAWAQGRAASVRKLLLRGYIGPESYPLEDFNAEDLGALVAVVGPSLTDIFVGDDLGHLCKKPFWESLRDSVVPAGRLRSLFVEDIHVESFGPDGDSFGPDVEPLGQLAGSLEELELHTHYSAEFPDPELGLWRFPEPFFALTKLRCLVLWGHPQMTVIPAGISSLKKLEVLDLAFCSLESLPREMGELSRLTVLNLSSNTNLGTTLPADEAFPAELGKMKSLRELNLFGCGLRSVPAFVGELESLEVLHLRFNFDLQIDAPLDFLVEGCPRLHEVTLSKSNNWTQESRARLRALKRKLHARNRNAVVRYF